MITFVKTDERPWWKQVLSGICQVPLVLLSIVVAFFWLLIIFALVSLLFNYEFYIVIGKILLLCIIITIYIVFYEWTMDNTLFTKER